MADNRSRTRCRPGWPRRRPGASATDVALGCVELCGTRRLRRGRAAREVGARREDPRHLRGHPADPAADGRAAAARQELRRTQVGDEGAGGSESPRRPRRWASGRSTIARSRRAVAGSPPPAAPELAQVGSAIRVAITCETGSPRGQSASSARPRRASIQPSGDPQAVVDPRVRRADRLSARARRVEGDAERVGQHRRRHRGDRRRVVEVEAPATQLEHRRLEARGRARSARRRSPGGRIQLAADDAVPPRGRAGAW